MKNNINIYHFSSTLAPYANVRMRAKSYMNNLNRKSTEVLV